MTPEQEAFLALPADEQRVEAAKDVLKQMAVGLYLPTQGIFVEPFDSDVVLDGLPPESLLVMRCEVCARGALGLSVARLRDRLADAHVEDAYGLYEDAPTGVLGLVFGSEEYYEIEQVFECSVRHPQYGGIAARYPTAESRLRVICENLIANNGTFKPGLIDV